MSRIPRHIIDEVRDRTDIVAVVQRQVALTRRGNSYVGLCPFHQEKTPSFHVVPGKHLFHCFGCQTGGDVFRFLMLLEGLSFIEAVKELANATGVVIEERELSADERKQLQRRASTYDVLEEAAQFYVSVLWTSPEGAPARGYLERRGLTEDTIKEARLGYAPGGWSALLDHMHGKGFPHRLLEEAGLARPRKGSGHYDFLRERVIFPIMDDRGRVIAFGGRILAGDAPKYMNTPESTVYDKAKVLYGLDRARQQVQRSGRVLLVEGYMDVLSLHQAGFTEAVATCGTSLTSDHLHKLRRMANDVVALFDTDEAGARAAERSLPMFIDAGMQPWRLELPGAKDPDDLIRQEGAQAMTQALERRVPLLEWVVQRRMESAGSHAGSQAQAIDDLLPMLASLPPAVVSGVAAKLKVNEQALLERLRGHVRRPEEPPPLPDRSGWRPNREMVHLFWLLVHRYDQVADLVARIGPDLVDTDPDVRGAVKRLVSGEPVAAVLPEVKDPGVLRTLSAVVAREHLYQPHQAALAACQILDGLGRPRREAALARLTHDGEVARREGDTDAWTAALSRRAAIVSYKNDLRAALAAEDIAGFMALFQRQPEVVP